MTSALLMAAAISSRPSSTPPRVLLRRQHRQPRREQRDDLRGQPQPLHDLPWCRQPRPDQCDVRELGDHRVQLPGDRFLLNNTNYDCSGFTIVSCNFPDPNVGVQDSLRAAADRLQWRLHPQLLPEPVRSQTFAQAGSSVSLGIGTDGAPGAIDEPPRYPRLNAVEESPTVGATRWPTTPTRRRSISGSILALESFIGVISEDMSTKGDVFACVSATGAADPRCPAVNLPHRQSGAAQRCWHPRAASI